jgi:Rrf2 family protein
MSISEVAEQEGLSVPYASKLLSILRKEGLVTAERGRTGGFTIARTPESINLLEVITALGGPLIDPNHCEKFTGQLDRCVHEDQCSVHNVLDGLAGFISEQLRTRTLQDVLDDQPEMGSGLSDSSILLTEQTEPQETRGENLQ